VAFLREWLDGLIRDALTQRPPVPPTDEREQRSSPANETRSELDAAECAAGALMDTLGHLRGIVRRGVNWPDCDSREPVGRALTQWLQDKAPFVEVHPPTLDAARDALIEARMGEPAELGGRREACALDLVRELACHAVNHLQEDGLATESGSRVLCEQLESSITASDLESLRVELRREFSLARQRARDQGPTGDNPQPDDAAFVPASSLLFDQYDTLKKLKAMLRLNPQIRTRKPSPQRLLVHAGDWHRALGQLKGASPDPLDLPAETVDAMVQDVQARKAIEQCRKAGK
jgi:hypothetical protein